MKSKAWFTLRHKHKHKYKHKHNACSHLLHKHEESDIRKRNEPQNEAVDVWGEARFQNGRRFQISCFFCCSTDDGYSFIHNFLITAAFISETCKCSLTNTNTKGFLFVMLKSSEPRFVVEARIIANCLGKFLVENNIYIKACYRPKTVAYPLTRALLEYPVTCNCTRLFTQTTVLDKSGHDCGKFNQIKCNRIPTQRSIQKLFLSN